MKPQQNKLTSEKLHILRHSLGLTRAKESYRNWFVTGPGSTDFELCRELVPGGLTESTPEKIRRFSFDDHVPHDQNYQPHDQAREERQPDPEDPPQRIDGSADGIAERAQHVELVLDLLDPRRHVLPALFGQRELDIEDLVLDLLDRLVHQADAKETYPELFGIKKPDGAAPDAGAGGGGGAKLLTKAEIEKMSPEQVNAQDSLLKVIFTACLPRMSIWYGSID